MNDALTNQSSGAMAPGIETRIETTADVEIARRIADGDRDAFEALMRRYNRRLYRTARSILSLSSSNLSPGFPMARRTRRCRSRLPRT